MSEATRWLLWREYRLNRPVWIAGTTFLIGPYLILWTYCFWYSASLSQFLDATAAASFGSLFASQMTLGALGCNAFAGERGDRSAEYIAYLPISRWSRLISKLVIAFLTFAVIWVHFGVARLFLKTVDSHIWNDWILHPGQIELVGHAAICVTTFYAVSWFASSFLSSPTHAAMIGLVTPAAVYFPLAMAHEARSISDAFVSYLFVIICFAISILTFTLGGLYFLRRVEP